MKSDKRFTHEQASTPTYKTWCAMIQRCTNPARDNYKYYGGKGIRVCAAWRRFEGFYADMGDRPKGFTLDRIDGNGPYCKENCRWAQKIAQARNTSHNRILTVRGEKMCLSEACERFSISVGTVWDRLDRGWSEEMAVTEPPWRGVPESARTAIAADNRFAKVIAAEYGVSKSFVDKVRRKARAA